MAQLRGVNTGEDGQIWQSGIKRGAIGVDKIGLLSMGFLGTPFVEIVPETR